MARYDKLEELLKHLDDVLRVEINRLDVTGFDELNALTAKHMLTEMLDRLIKANRKAYKEMAKSASHEVADELVRLFPMLFVKNDAELENDEKGKKLKPKTIYPTNEYIDGLLGEPNPVTNYLYYPEAERKRSRLYEVVMVALLTRNRVLYHDNLRKFSSLWHTQTVEYGITVIDKTRMKVLEINGIKKVKWIAEKDDKTCSICKERDGKIYDLDKIPPKPHYNCRCWIEPIIEDSEKNT